MAYFYEVSFDLEKDEVDELEMGHSLQRVLGFLKVNLPGQTGHVTSSAMYSVDDAERTRVVFISEWNTWEDVVNHCESALFEDKVITEFGPRITAERLTHRFYAEVGTETY